MPLSRQQIITSNQARIGQIAAELAEIQELQGQTTEAEKQQELLRRKAELETEQTSLEAANAVLREQLAEYNEKQAAAAEKHWTDVERPKLQKAVEHAATIVEERMVKAANGYRDLLAAEERAKTAWKKAGRPGQPAKTRSKRSFGSFLGVTQTRPLARSQARVRHFNKLFSISARSK